MTRVTETTFEELENFAYITFMDGIIQGMPLGKNLVHILDTAYMFGLDEAERSHSIPYSASADATTDEIRREMTAVIVAALFGGKGLRGSLNVAVHVAAALGFQTARNKREIIGSAAHAAFDEVLAADQRNPGKQIDMEISEAFFAEINKLDLERSDGFMKLFHAREIAFDNSGVQYKLAVRRYIDTLGPMLMG